MSSVPAVGNATFVAEPARESAAVTNPAHKLESSNSDVQALQRLTLVAATGEQSTDPTRSTQPNDLRRRQMMEALETPALNLNGEQITKPLRVVDARIHKPIHQFDRGERITVKVTDGSGQNFQIRVSNRAPGISEFSVFGGHDDLLGRQVGFIHTRPQLEWLSFAFPNGNALNNGTSDLTSEQQRAFGRFGENVIFQLQNAIKMGIEE